MHFFIVCVCFSLAITLQGVSNDNYGIPRKIWQTYRYKELPRPAEEARASWIEQNPNYEYQLMDDADIENYILSNWDAQMYEFFKSLPIGVMKADLWRYLIIADQGGVYSDVDSICCLPIDCWISFLGSLHKIEAGKPLLFLGVEEDNEKEVIDFCQWTFMATPKHPAMEFACEYILDNWRKKGIDLTAKRLVHYTTGPTILKHAMMTYFGEPLSMRASDFYRKYKSDRNLREKLNNLGVYILSDVFYNGFASVHLVGSKNFKEGYISWAREEESFRNCPQEGHLKK